MAANTTRRDVLLLKDDVRDFADRLFERHANRLRSEDPKYRQRVKMFHSIGFMKT